MGIIVPLKSFGYDRAGLGGTQGLGLGLDNLFTKVIDLELPGRQNGVQGFDNVCWNLLGGL